MQKLACIFSYKMSSWVSCQKIVFNLHKAYHLCPQVELLNFNLSSDQTNADISKTAQEIFKASPEVIVVMDHKPHPLALFQFLLPLYKSEKRPRIIFHVFGDFTLFYQQWDKLAHLLKGFEVDFMVASDRQKILIDKFLLPPMSSMVCPFPVDKNEFCFRQALRKTQRNEWGLKENDIAYVFTGRLSRQKRIHTLLKSFAEALSKTKDQSAHLYLYGHTDHLGDNFLGKWEVEGEYFRKIFKLYKSFPESIQKRIHFMGSVPNSELKSVYQGADFLVNLSVHNDEDFGMSVAEAQCSGLPSILTEWGGLASFKHQELLEATRFISVKIGKRNKLIQYPRVVELLEETSKNKFSQREELSRLALEKFSVEASQKIIENLLSQKAQKFEGFSPLFKKVLHHTSFSYTPYLTESKEINPLFRELYSSYV